VDPFLFVGFDSTAEQQLACARNWLRLRKIDGVERTWNPAEFSDDKIRVAYLSGDFRRHAVANVIGELFELHDRNRFEIVGVSFGPNDGSAIRSRLIKAFDRFIDATNRSDQDVARLLRDLKTNIAVDLVGHTNYARMGILADRAAPVQVTYLGFPGTTGADFIDYIIGDEAVLPPSQQPFFTEKFVHLPDSYQVNDSKLPLGSVQSSRAGFGLPDKAFVFCCFNNPYKITQPVFEIWMRLLKSVPGSVLWLFGPNRLTVTNLRQEAVRHRVEPERLVFAPSLDIADHIGRQQFADLFLDTLPYNGHATASASLWAGVPVLTCLGKTFPGRVGASLLRAIGLPELVTETLGKYEALGLRLASDHAMLAAIRAKLAQNRRTHPLFDTDRFRRHIEAAYVRMWKTFKRGEPPQNFSVDPIGDSLVIRINH
jgi:predicted O-linked N-acetylglucosamine transferase (SPINDLY family)